MEEQFERTKLLLGEDALKKLKKSHVIIFGLGGVGGYALEVLVRAGIGEVTLVDNDVISPSNINRQILALHSTVGLLKTQAAENRIKDINPKIKTHIKNCFFLPETASDFDFSDYDYVIDCIDTVTAKLSLIEKAKKENVPVITCLGTGNKLDPAAFKLSTVEKTKVCPLGRVLRRELKKRNISDVPCVYSEEKPFSIISDSSNGRHAPASVSFVPPSAGILLASKVILDLIKRSEKTF